jgi:hypothetical protein
LVNWPAGLQKSLDLEMRLERRDADGGAWIPITETTAAWKPIMETSGASAGHPTSDLAAHQMWLDRHFEWEHTYFYKITPITRVMKDGKIIAEVEGDDSPEIRVFTKDVFPPAQPAGVQAVFSGTGQKPFMDVTWAPNTEEDLAGYNVFRHEQVGGRGSDVGTGLGAIRASAATSGAPEKINAELVKSPSFRDENVAAGHTYFYSVSALDLRNNESPRSEETSEAIPK